MIIRFNPLRLSRRAGEAFVDDLVVFRHGARAENQPTRLDLAAYPYPPSVSVQTASPAE